MSAIIAGTCKECNKKHYVSFGHPMWWVNGARDECEGKPPNPEYRRFEEIQASGLCLHCWHIANPKIDEELKKFREEEKQSKLYMDERIIFFTEAMAMVGDDLETEE